MLWFPLHAPEKVGTEGDEFLFIKYFYLYIWRPFLRRRRTKFLTTFFFIRSRLLAFTSNSQPPLVGGATAKTIKIFRHGGFQVDTDG
jgi:hypothetical protein